MGALDATRRILTLGSRDSTTGHRAVDYSNTETIEGVRVNRGGDRSVAGVMVHPRDDMAFCTADPILEDDQILTQQGDYFEVVLVQMKYGPTPDNFLFRLCQCHGLPEYEASAGSATWQTSPNDPQERSKTWVDTYARDAQITKDDGVTEAAWACMFSDPPYSLGREFRASSNAVQGLYIVGEPSSTPLMDPLAQAPYGYEENVPITVATIDSTACAGKPLNWAMQKELRYVMETYSGGSLRVVTATRPETLRLGSMMFWQSTYMLSYRRDTT